MPIGSALQPCLHVQALARAMYQCGVPPSQWPCDAHTSRKDCPHAYRKIPMKPDHSWACVVAFHDPATQGPRFRSYKGMLFGLPLAASAFIRLPLLLHSVGRRFLGVLISLYFGDLTQKDWSLLAVKTQHLVAELFEMFGFPFAPKKRQSPSASGDFSGLLHDLSGLRATGHIRVWVRQRLVD